MTHLLPQRSALPWFSALQLASLTLAAVAHQYPRTLQTAVSWLTKL